MSRVVLVTGGSKGIGLAVAQRFAALGDKSTARLFWQAVIDTYPKSKAAKEAKSLLAR